MKLIRRLKTLVVLGVFALILAGCTNNNTGNTTGNTTAPVDQTIRLQFWGVFWDNTIMDPLIAEYKTQNPNVEITYQNKWPGGNRGIASSVYKTNLERVLNTNDPDQIPDLFMVENTWAGNYDERYTSPAPASVIDAATVGAQFYAPVTTDFVTNNQNVNGLPLWMDTLAIVYNKDLLEQVAVTKPPTDWVGFRNLAKTLTKRTGNTMTQGGFAAGSGTNTDFGVELVYALIMQNGVIMVNAAGDPVFANDPDSESAVKFFLDFTNKSVIGSWDSAMPNDSLSFLQGKTAMIAVPAWRYKDILFFNDRYKLGLDLDVSPMPQIDANNPQNMANYWGVMVAKNRPNSVEAWKFLTWLTQKEQLRKLRASDAAQGQFGFLYPRKDMQDELRFEAKVSVYNTALSSAKSWYMIDGTKVEDIFKKMIAAGGKASDISSAQSQVRDVIEGKGLLLR
jgi:ABC-type glycerol-3-phosphate transport system substrate-binding protein